MCSIFGFVGFEEDGLLEAMARCLSHRGPDGEGFFRKPGPVSVGMTRLSIIDLEGGWQPIENEDGRLTVVCNGEIYNFVELRAELEAKGHHFKTRSDVECLVHGLEEWGEGGLLARLNGMYAFALHDAGDGSLLIVRDRVGQKPLYYCESPDGLLFASEIRALLKSRRVPRELNLPQLDAYLALRYVPEPETMFAGIRCLPPGCAMRVQPDGRFTIREYWSPPRPAVRHDLSDAQALEELDALFTDAVRLTLRSDVPISAYLSSGIDSTLVCAKMRELGATVRSFSLGFGSSIDETPAARRTAELLGTEHHEVICTPADLLRLPTVVRQMERPVGDALIVAFDRLNAAAAAHFRVVLGGEGADELFAGYSFHALVRLFEKYRKVVPDFVHRGLAVPALKLAPLGLLDRFSGFPAALGSDGKARLVEFADGYARRSITENIFLLRSLFAQSQRADLLTGDAAEAARSRSWLAPFHGAHDGSLDAMLRGQFGEWIPDWLIVRQEKNSMAHSLEYRMPFFDHRLIEFAFALPDRMKLRQGKVKWLLRQLAAKTLPAEVVNRPKIPFYFPVEHFTQNAEFQQLVGDALSDETLKCRGLFDPVAVAALQTQAQSGEFLPLKKLMSLVILELWQREFLD